MQKSLDITGYLILSKYLYVDCLITNCYHDSAGSLNYLFSFYYPHNLLGQRESKDSF